MITQLVYIFLISMISTVFRPSESMLQLSQTNVICRHGTRSPTKPFPADPYKDVWPQGYGQLTRVGINETFNLGQYLKNHYQGFINSTYINDELYVRSSDFERTLMSGESILAGLYPPSGFQVWNKKIRWQPIPVHTEASTDDILLDMDNTICPQYDKLYNEDLERDEFKMKNESFNEYYEYLNKMTNKTEAMGPMAVWDVVDDLIARKINAIPLPSWVTDKDMDIMANFFVPWEMKNKFNSLAKGRIKGGPLITELVSNMNRSRNGNLDPSERKLFLYSGHDNNLVTVMLITDTFNELYVPFASALMVELYRDGHEYYVMMKLHNNTNVNPYVLNITVCGNKKLCPLNEFIEKVSPFLITKDQWLKECELQPSLALSLVAVMSIAVGAAILAILIIGTIIYLYKIGLKPKPGTKLDEPQNEASPLFK